MWFMLLNCGAAGRQEAAVLGVRHSGAHQIRIGPGHAFDTGHDRPSQRYVTPSMWPYTHYLISVQTSLFPTDV